MSRQIIMRVRMRVRVRVWCACVVCVCVWKGVTLGTENNNPSREKATQNSDAGSTKPHCGGLMTFASSIFTLTIFDGSLPGGTSLLKCKIACRQGPRNRRRAEANFDQKKYFKVELWSRDEHGAPCKEVSDGGKGTGR